MLKTNKKNDYILIVLTSFVLNFGSFTKPIKDFHSFRQSQNGIAARAMHENGITIFTPSPYFGIDSQLPLEFPFLQIISAFLQDIGISETFTLRPVSWIIFLFFLITTNKAISLYSSNLASFSSAFLLFHPLMYTYSNAYMIEFIPHLFGALSFLYFYKNKNYISGVFLTLSLLSKITTGCIYALFLLLFYFKKNKFSLKEFITISSIVLIPNLIWQYIREIIIESNTQTNWLTSKNLRYWNFSTKEQFFSLEHWYDLLNYLLSNIWNSNMFPLLGYMFLFLIIYKNKYFLIPIIPIVLFSNLYWVHDYYFIAVVPFFALIISEFFIKTFKNENIRSSLFILLICFISIGQANKYIATKVYDDLAPYSFSNTLNKYNQNNVYLASIYDWNPSYFYEANKKGIMWNPKYSQIGLNFSGNEIENSKINLFILQKNYFNENHLKQFVDYQLSQDKVLKIEVFEDFVFLSEEKDYLNNFAYLALVDNTIINKACVKNSFNDVDTEFYFEIKNYLKTNFNISLYAFKEGQLYNLDESCNI